ncbi:MAG TPA: hypothetical protein VG963_06120 [Polyangiaceae bacterium]|nr:hypothetical protein [Polyangiaceae bacterium]
MRTPSLPLLQSSRQSVGAASKTGVCCSGIRICVQQDHEQDRRSAQQIDDGSTLAV